MEMDLKRIEWMLERLNDERQKEAKAIRDATRRR